MTESATATDKSKARERFSKVGSSSSEDLMPTIDRDAISTDLDETPSSGFESWPATSPANEILGSPVVSPNMISRASRERKKANLPPAIVEEDSDVVSPTSPSGVPPRGPGPQAALEEQVEIKSSTNKMVSRVENAQPRQAADLEAEPEAEAEVDDDDDDDDEGPRDPSAPRAEPVMTPGSVLHGTGECRPCMWFYKPQGCQNGAECLHCHLCPEGEIKSRKKSKAEGLKMKKLLTKGSESSRGPESPLATVTPKATVVIGAPLPAPPPGLELGASSSGMTSPVAGDYAAQALGVSKNLMSIGSVGHGSGDCRPCAWFHKPQGCGNGADCRHCHLCPEGEIKARRKMKVSTGPVVPDKAEIKGLKLPFPSAQQRRNEPLPSIGSELHGTELCRPCAWFHKPSGCENGAECRHCHLCPEGEIQKRRKHKVAQLKREMAKNQDLTVEQALWVVQKQQEALIAMSMHAQQVQAMWEAMVAAEVERSPLLDYSPMARILAAAGGSPVSNTAAAAALAQAQLQAQAQAQVQALSHAQAQAQVQALTQAQLQVQLQAAQAAQAQGLPASLFSSPSAAATAAAAAAAASATGAGAGAASLGSASPSASVLSALAALEMDGFDLSSAMASLSDSGNGAMPSYGSALHATGDCTPCASFRKLKGCKLGEMCLDCHLCTDGREERQGDSSTKSQSRSPCKIELSSIV